MEPLCKYLMPEKRFRCMQFSIVMLGHRINKFADPKFYINFVLIEPGLEVSHPRHGLSFCFTLEVFL